jgi:hypothetical protein
MFNLLPWVYKSILEFKTIFAFSYQGSRPLYDQQDFIASTISTVNEKLDVELKRFRGRELAQKHSYLTVNAHYEKVRDNNLRHFRI